MIYRYASPLGELTYQWQDGCCHRLWLNAREDAVTATPEQPVALWLTAYFRGEQRPLPPCAPAHTPFQRRLREALLDIPFGETRSYGQLATLLQTAPRALGQALAANRLPLLFPCHRVVAADTLGGFAGGALWKAALLTFETSRTRPVQGGSAAV